MSTLDLQQFLDRSSAKIARDQAYANWHLLAHHLGGIDLPYDPCTNYVQLTVYKEDGDYGVDEAATLDNLARVARFAAGMPGVTVEKNYSSDFELRITVERDGDDLYLHYYADREAVCTKRVIGTEIVPEKIVPAHEKEIIEWDCDPVSLLAREVS